MSSETAKEGQNKLSSPIDPFNFYTSFIEWSFLARSTYDFQSLIFLNSTIRVYKIENK